MHKDSLPNIIPIRVYLRPSVAFFMILKPGDALVTGNSEFRPRMHTDAHGFLCFCSSNSHPCVSASIRGLFMILKPGDALVTGNSELRPRMHTDAHGFFAQHSSHPCVSVSIRGLFWILKPGDALGNRKLGTHATDAHRCHGFFAQHNSTSVCIRVHPWLLIMQCWGSLRSRMCGAPLVSFKRCRSCARS
jgi:hypothetical protein